jgi:hypothetical protein
MQAVHEPEISQSLAGRTLRWTFAEGPTAGKTFEHTFHSDGTVVWRGVDGAAQDKPKREGGASASAPPKVRYASFEVAPDTHLVSYLSEAGFTLTVALNFKTGQCYGVASNNEAWYPLTGTFESIE